MRPFQNFTFLEEPAVITLEKIDQAVVIRDLGDIKNTNSKFVYLSGFAALHETVGLEIANQNGSNDPFKFWTLNYVMPSGRAMGELAARTGLQFDSPHSQNFLIELTTDMKPTGRIVLRDMADFFLDKNILTAMGEDGLKLLNEFTQKENIKDYISAGFGPLHGNRKPKWVSENLYEKWNDFFFDAFEASFNKISGYNLSELNVKRSQYYDYFLAKYKLKDESKFKGYFDLIKENGYLPELAPFCGLLFTRAASQ